MTGNEILRQRINDSGMSDSFIADRLNLKEKCFQQKVRGAREFNANEINALKDLLNLSIPECNVIFF